MNGNQIINMIIRIVMRKAINGGINAGMKRVSGGGNARRGPRQQPQAAYTPPPPVAPQAPSPVQEFGPQDAKIQQKLARKRAARAEQAAARTNDS